MSSTSELHAVRWPVFAQVYCLIYDERRGRPATRRFGCGVWVIRDARILPRLKREILNSCERRRFPSWQPTGARSVECPRAFFRDTCAAPQLPQRSKESMWDRGLGELGSEMERAMARKEAKRPTNWFQRKIRTRWLFRAAFSGPKRNGSFVGREEKRTTICLDRGILGVNPPRVDLAA